MTADPNGDDGDDGDDVDSIEGTLRHRSSGDVSRSKFVVYGESILRWLVGFGTLGIYAWVVYKSMNLATKVEEAEVLVALFVTPLATLIASIAGYYFGEKKRSSLF